MNPEESIVKLSGLDIKGGQNNLEFYFYHPTNWPYFFLVLGICCFTLFFNCYTYYKKKLRPVSYSFNGIILGIILAEFFSSPFFYNSYTALPIYFSIIPIFIFAYLNWKSTHNKRKIEEAT